MYKRSCIVLKSRCIVDQSCLSFQAWILSKCSVGWQMVAVRSIDWCLHHLIYGILLHVALPNPRVTFIILHSFIHGIWQISNKAASLVNSCTSVSVLMSPSISSCEQNRVVDNSFRLSWVGKRVPLRWHSWHGWALWWLSLNISFYAFPNVFSTLQVNVMWRNMFPFPGLSRIGIGMVLDTMEAKALQKTCINIWSWIIIFTGRRICPINRIWY